MEIRILGSVEVAVSGRMVPVPRRHEQLVLAVLVLGRGRPVPWRRLIDLIWGDQPPAAARAVLRRYVSRLRTALIGEATGSGARLQRSGDGYALQVSGGRLMPNASDVWSSRPGRPGT